MIRGSWPHSKFWQPGMGPRRFLPNSADAKRYRRTGSHPIQDRLTMLLVAGLRLVNEIASVVFRTEKGAKFLRWTINLLAAPLTLGGDVASCCHGHRAHYAQEDHIERVDRTRL